MKTTLAAVILACAAAAAGAQTQASPQAAAPNRLIDNVMVAMYDAPGTGEMIVQYLRDNGVSVAFDARVPNRSGHATDAKTGKSMIGIAPSYQQEPVSYRRIGVRIAKEAAELMLADFPESAEKRYMAASRMAETYFELGGTRIDMQNVDGPVDPEAEKLVFLWVENAPDEGVRVLKGQGAQTLDERIAWVTKERQEMINYSMTDWEEIYTRELEQLHAAKARFQQFKKYETDWLMSHSSQLQ